MNTRNRLWELLFWSSAAVMLAVLTKQMVQNSHSWWCVLDGLLVGFFIQSALDVRQGRGPWT